nr:PIN domain nuclease [uncultured Rhodopila sp.]
MTAAVFVDSSVWIDHLRGAATPGTRALRTLLDALDPDAGEDDPAEILVGDLVLLEVLRGISADRQYDATRSALLAFTQVRIGGTATALAAVDHYRSLRRRGITVRKAVDCLIAAWCIARRVPLLHADRDFAPFAEHCGLLVHEIAPEPPAGYSRPDE